MSKLAVCELISVGTEILLGDILNTDAQFLSIELARLGISVIHQSTVGDNRERLLAQLKEAADRSDIIILSGGLGPTPDDLTKEVCCEFFGKKMFLPPKFRYQFAVLLSVFLDSEFMLIKEIFISPSKNAEISCDNRKSG